MPYLPIKRNVIIFVIALFFAALISLYCLHDRKKPSQSLILPEAVYTIPRQIHFGYTVKNSTNRLVPRAELWVYAPVAQTGTQKCISISSQPTNEIIKDPLGNQTLHFVLENIPPYATRVIHIQADLMLNDTPNRLTGSNPVSFLAAEKYIESDDPRIQRQANQLKKATDSETITALFDWVAGHVQYEGYVSRDRGAFYALLNAKGDCTEYAHLFSALARSQNIPARVMGGYICQTNTKLDASGYHNWAEFYETDVWKLADPQNKVLRENHADYIAMRVVGPTEENPMGDHHRFRLEGEGLSVRMN